MRRLLSHLLNPVAVALVVSALVLVVVVRSGSDRLFGSPSPQPPPEPPTEGSEPPPFAPGASEDGSTAPPTLFVAPGGRGPCEASSPCGSVDEAYQRARSGDVVELRPGRYPRQVVRPRPDSVLFATNVVVRPPPGRTATVDGALIHGGRLTLRGVRSVGPVTLRPGATGSRLERMTIEGHAVRNRRSAVGAAVGLGADRTALVDSVVTGNVDEDLLKVQMGATDVLVEANRIGDGRVGPLAGHVDCIQVQGGHRVVIRRNLLYRCSNSALIVSSKTAPVSDIVVENNFIQDCYQRTAACRGRYAVYLQRDRAGSNDTVGLRFLHNTVDGAVSLAPDLPGLEVRGNIIRELNQCGGFEDWNMIESTRCRNLSPNDRRGRPAYADRERVDLRLRKGSPGIGMGGPLVPALDIQGQPAVGTGNVGAYQGDGT